MELDEDEVDRLLSAFEGIARQLKNLGNADASTPMGAIEAHGKAVDDAAERLAGEIDEVATRLGDVAEALEHIADAIKLAMPNK